MIVKSDSYLLEDILVFLRISATLLLLFLIDNLFASFNLVGKVLDDQTKQPLTGATVVIKGAQRGAYTDQKGVFILEKVEKENILVVEYIGYKTQTIQLNDIKNLLDTLYVFLKEAPIKMNGVVVTAERDITQKNVSFFEISGENIYNVPPVVLNDINNVLEYLPGVNKNFDYKSSITFDGAAPYQSAYTLDGIHIYHPYHFFGFSNAINADVVHSLNVYNGIIPLRFQNATGGLVAVKLPSVAEKEKTTLDINFANFSISHLRTYGKFTLLSAFSKTYVDFISKVAEEIPAYGNFDFTNKISYLFNHKMGVEFLFHLSNDFFTKDININNEIAEDFGFGKSSFKVIKGLYNWGYGVLGGQLKIENRNIFSSFRISYLYDYMKFNKLINNNFSDFTIDFNTQYTYSPNFGFEMGGNFKKLVGDYFWSISGGDLGDMYPASHFALDSTFVRNMISGYFSSIIKRDRFRAKFGVKYTYTTFSNTIGYSGSFYYTLNERSGFSLGIGRNMQYLISPFTRRELTIKNPVFFYSTPLISNVLDFGYIQKFNNGREYRIRLYGRYSNGVPYYNENNYAVQSDLNSKEIGIQTIFINNGKYFSYQLLYNYIFSRISGEETWFDPGWAPKHSFKAMAGAHIKNKWYLVLTLQVKSGLPYTPIIYAYKGYSKYSNDTDLSERLIYGKQNSKYYPAYIRVDFSLRKIFFKKNYSYLAYFQIINLFNRKNILRVNWDSYIYSYKDSKDTFNGVIVGFPIIPSMGIKFIF
jgi:hypothetical protein